MRRALLIVALTGAALAAGAADKPTTTVLDFKVNNVSVADMQSIVSFLSASLFDTGHYTVIDSTQRDALLDELEFSTSDCTDEACQLEIGKLLAAEFIVVGDIGKVGTRIMLTAKMLETETSRTVSTAKGIYADLDKLLDDMAAIAASLASSATAAAAPQPAATPAATGAAAARVARPTRPPPSARRVVAWSCLGAGAAGAGAGGYLFYAAAAFRTQVLAPSYAAYQATATDYGGLTAEQYYDGLWSTYVGNMDRYRAMAVVATAVAGGGAALLATSIVLLSLPDATPRAAVSLELRPTPTGTLIGVGVAY